MAVVHHQPNPVFVAAGAPVVRSAPRPVPQRQAGYDDSFDATTIFYDVIHLRGRLWLFGPPLREFGDLLDRAEILLDGKVCEAPRVRLDQNRCVRVTIDCPEPPTTFTLRTPDLSVSAPVTVADPSVFAGRKVLYTLSKDNELSWIVDWARYYALNHGADAVLLYDNASTGYTPLQISNVLAAVPGIKVVQVVPWMFRYGPAGGVWAGDASIPWDSDYAQIGAMTNARYAWLSEAAGVVNADIDELVVAPPGVSLFSRLASSDEGYLRYSGYWIDSVTARPRGNEAPRHADYWLRDRRRNRCGFKWSAVPSRIPDDTQWTAHSIYGMPTRSDDQFVIAHFRAVNRDWKTARTAPVAYDPSRHELQLRLLSALRRAFPAQFDPGRFQRAIEWAANDADRAEAESLTTRFRAAVVPKLPQGRLTRAWVWRQSTVVLDCRSDGRPLGFDTYVSAAKVDLTVVARDPKDAARLRRAVDAVGIETTGGRRHGARLRTWLESGPPIDLGAVATEVAELVAAVCAAFDAAAADPKAAAAPAADPTPARTSA